MMRLLAISALFLGVFCNKVDATNCTVQNNQVFHNKANLIVKDKVVEVEYIAPLQSIYVPAANLGLEYYYRVAEQLNNEDFANQVADKVVEKLSSEGYVVNGNDVPDTPTPDDPKPENPEDLISVQTTNIFRKYCNSCHSGESPSGIMVLMVDDKINPDLDKLAKWKIFDRVDGSYLDADKRMPKNAEALSDEQVAIIRKWVRQSK